MQDETGPERRKPAPPAPAEWDEETGIRFRKGVEEFNTGYFFECHDTLEEIWQGMRGPARDFLQGLIQISVAFYHLRNGNLRGGESQLEKGLFRLEGYGDCYQGIDLAALRQGAAIWLGKIRAGADLRASVVDLPKFLPPRAL